MCPQKGSVESIYVSFEGAPGGAVQRGGLGTPDAGGELRSLKAHGGTPGDCCHWIQGNTSGMDRGGRSAPRMQGRRAHEPEAPKRGRAHSTPVPPRPRAPDPGEKRPENPLPGSLSALRLPLRARHRTFPKARGARRRREPGPAPAVAHNAPGGTASVPSTPFLLTAQATIARTIDRPPQTPVAVLQDPLRRRSFRRLPASGF